MNRRSVFRSYVMNDLFTTLCDARWSLVLSLGAALYVSLWFAFGVLYYVFNNEQLPGCKPSQVLRERACVCARAIEVLLSQYNPFLSWGLGRCWVFWTPSCCQSIPRPPLGLATTLWTHPASMLSVVQCSFSDILVQSPLEATDVSACEWCQRACACASEDRDQEI